MTAPVNCCCTSVCAWCGERCSTPCEHRAKATAAAQSNWSQQQPWPTEERVKELVSFEVRRLLGSPHAFGALEDRVRQLENGAQSTVQAQIEAALERVAGQIVHGLTADKFPQYREDWEDKDG